MVRTASPVREAHLYPPHLPFPKHRPIVENGTFSTGPFVRNRREPRPGRPREAPPTQAACMRGVRGPARRMESSPAPGSLWFLSPAGKELVRPQTHETPSSHTLNPARVPPLLIPLPSLVPLPNFSLPLSLLTPKPQKREARRFLIQASLSGFRQRPTLPGRVQPSTIGAEGLNFCVRYGNRWYPFAIITGNCELVFFPHTLTTAQHSRSELP